MGANYSGTSTIGGLALLKLPPLDKLTDAQTRGVDCVQDGVTLTSATAVNLGERLSSLDGTDAPMRWFPRACRTCILTLAMRSLHDHAPRCEQCVDDAARCETGLGLRRLMREYRR
jgi:hypothetical protein